MDGAKVVQLYVSQTNVAGAPKRSLIAMEKVFVAAGASATVELQTAAYKGFCAFCVYGTDGNGAIPAGTSYKLAVGNGGSDAFSGVVVTAA